jgi:serine/threonine protein phosphatase PrpC
MQLHVPDCCAQTRVASATRSGVYPGQPERCNQDSFCVYKPYCNDNGLAFFGVFDGHGPVGALCSAFAAQAVRPKHVKSLCGRFTILRVTCGHRRCTKWVASGRPQQSPDGPVSSMLRATAAHPQHDEEVCHCIKSNSCVQLPLQLARDPEFPLNCETAGVRAFLATNQGLHDSNVEDSFSGTTALVAIVHGSLLTICCAGDSRAVLAIGTADGLVARQISWDHTLMRCDERSRVRVCGGRVLTQAQMISGQLCSQEAWSAQVYTVTLAHTMVFRISLNWEAGLFWCARSSHRPHHVHMLLS